MLKSKKSRKGAALGAAVLAGVIAVSGYALTDVLAVPADSHAGDGAKNVEAVAATEVHYTLNTTDPSKIDAITFKLDKAIAATGAVFTQPIATGGTTTGGSAEAGHWYSCVIAAAGADTVCDTTGSDLFATDVSQIRVVAAD